MKRKFYFWIKKCINAQTIQALLMLIVVATLAILQIMDKEFNLMDYVDKGILAAICLLLLGDLLAKLIRFIVAKCTEDTAKVSADYNNR